MCHSRGGTVVAGGHNALSLAHNDCAMLSSIARGAKGDSSCKREEVRVPVWTPRIHDHESSSGSFMCPWTWAQIFGIATGAHRAFHRALDDIPTWSSAQEAVEQPPRWQGSVRTFSVDLRVPVSVALRKIAREASASVSSTRGGRALHVPSFAEAVTHDWASKCNFANPGVASSWSTIPGRPSYRSSRGPCGERK